MTQVAERVIRQATKEILKEFKEEYIAGVYKKDPVVYRNDGIGFSDAWEWEDIQKNASSISSKMFYNSKKTQSIPDAFDEMDNLPYRGYGIHGSLHWETSDVTDIMPEIMNEDGKKSSHPMTFDRPYKYWDKFINEYVNGGKLRSLMNRIAKENGLDLK